MFTSWYMNIHKLDLNRLVFDIINFGEPEVEISPFCHANLAMKKTRNPSSLKQRSASFVSLNYIFLCLKCLAIKLHQFGLWKMNFSAGQGRIWIPGLALNLGSAKILWSRGHIMNSNQHAFNIKYLVNLITNIDPCWRYQKLTNSPVFFPSNVCVQVRRQ